MTTQTPQIQYLTGVSNEITRSAARSDLGLLGTPAGSTWKQKDSYGTWAADNGCFVELSRPGAFNADKWLSWLDKAGPANCLWATLPDVVGDAVETWRRSEPYVELVRNLGFPVATVLQDGLEEHDDIFAAMLDASDAVFIGGSTDWKLGTDAAGLAAVAKSAGKAVHMGRVNSLKRLRYAASIGCDTADGTYVGFGPTTNAPRMLRWLDIVNSSDTHHGI